jgi:alanyl-tRNA synthetase
VEKRDETTEKGTDASEIMIRSRSGFFTEHQEEFMEHGEKLCTWKIPLQFLLIFIVFSVSTGAAVIRSDALRISFITSATTLNKAIDDTELTRAEKKALRKQRKKERKEAEKKRRAAEKIRKKRQELIQKALEMRRQMLENEVKSEIVWKNCNVGILSVDEGLDEQYIERMLKTYLSYLAKVIADRNGYGEYIVNLTVDRDGKVLDLMVLQDTFNNIELVRDLEKFFTTRNYGGTRKMKPASLQLVVTRNITQTNRE